MKNLDLYAEACFECSKIITRKYSTSFSIGIKVFEKQLQYPIYGIYGFVRLADEIVDTFHNQDKSQLIQQFQIDTFAAIEQKISLNPVLQSFQMVVNHYDIPSDLIKSFLYSMEMDLDTKLHNEDSYEKYIYGSAEVVGLMCLKVFCHGDENLYQSLIPAAQKLGAAFQKVNFLRDIKDDFEDKGRTYFPNINFSNFSEADKKTIESDIQNDFDEAFIGLQKLPISSRKGVFVAFTYYQDLLKKIKNTPAMALVNTRVRITDSRKMWLLAQAILHDKMSFICEK